MFSLNTLRKLLKRSSFQSHIDGSSHLFTPEKVMSIENNLGADIIMAFDECAPYPAEKSYIDDSLSRTTRWLERCVKAHKRSSDQALFGIIQGGMYKDLRRKSTKQVTSFDLPGYAIGGLSVGEPSNLMYEMLEEVTPLMPFDKPRYLMGVGTPDIDRGINKRNRHV